MTIRLKPSESPDKLVFAATKTGQPITLSLGNPVMVGILGATGSGKSVLLNNLCCLLRKQMQEKVQFIAFDPKLTSVLPIRSILSLAPVTEPSDFLPMLNKLLSIMEERLRTMQERGWSKIDPLKHSEEFPQIIVIFEELLSYLHNPDLDKASQQAIAQGLISYCTRCRASNMGFILASHDYAEGTNGVPKQVRSSCRSRAVFRCGSNEVSTFTDGQQEKAPAHLLTQVGLFYWSDNGDITKWSKGATEYKPDEFYEGLCVSYALYNRDVESSFSVSGLFD